MPFYQNKCFPIKSLLVLLVLSGTELRAQTPVIVKPQPASKQPAGKQVLASEAVQLGQKQFAASCSFCHGANANGGAEGPNLILSSLVRHDKNGDLVGPVIRQGRPSKGMPPFPLSAEQITDIAAFLHARITLSDIRSATGKGDYSLKQLLTGNAEAGKKFFYGEGGCRGCHSPDKDLAGVAKKYSPMELQGRFLYPEGSARPTVTVTLPSGSKVYGELVHKDAFTVALRDADGWYHSWPIHSVHVEVQDPLAAHLKLLGRYSNPDVHNLFAYLETLQ
jgi:cytochrome c oxidase cbb3-type subunit 3